MATPTHPKQVFTNRDLEALDLALVGAIAVAKELGVDRKGLEGVFRRRLFDIASDGVRDPETMCAQLVRSMNLDRLAK